MDRKTNSFDKLCLIIGLSLIYASKVGVILGWHFANTMVIDEPSIFDMFMSGVSVNSLFALAYFALYWMEYLAMDGTKTHEHEVLRYLRAHQRFEDILTPLP